MIENEDHSINTCSKILLLESTVHLSRFWTPFRSISFICIICFSFLWSDSGRYELLPRSRAAEVWRAEDFRAGPLGLGVMDTALRLVRVRCCLLFIYMPAVDRSLPDRRCSARTPRRGAPDLDGPGLLDLELTLISSNGLGGQAPAVSSTRWLVTHTVTPPQHDFQGYLTDRICGRSSTSPCTENTGTRSLQPSTRLCQRMHSPRSGSVIARAPCHRLSHRVCSAAQRATVPHVDWRHLAQGHIRWPLESLCLSRRRAHSRAPWSNFSHRKERGEG